MSAVLTGPISANAFAAGERDLRRQLNALIHDATAALGIDLELPGDGAAALDAGLAIITAVALLTVEELHGIERRAGRGEVLLDLALRCAELDARLRNRDLNRRKAALVGVESALARLRSITAPDDLINGVCPELIRSCGFSRVMLSRVTGTQWKPWAARFSYRPVRDSDQEWMDSGVIPLSSMVLERELLEARRSGFVADTAADGRVSAHFIRQTGSRSYAVAPIMPKGRVIGLLHADYHPSSRVADEVDAHILGAFADGFGRLFERAVLLERLGRERNHVRDTLRTAETIMDNLARAEVELVRQADGQSSSGTATTLAMAPGSSAIDAILTAREREVMALLVTGQTNSMIAERLVISEGTVKSHVKQILRKLGAMNRSEVIARYLGVMSES